MATESDIFPQSDVEGFSPTAHKASENLDSSCPICLHPMYYITGTNNRFSFTSIPLFIPRQCLNRHAMHLRCAMHHAMDCRKKRLLPLACPVCCTRFHEDDLKVVLPALFEIEVQSLDPSSEFEVEMWEHFDPSLWEHFDPRLTYQRSYLRGRSDSVKVFNYRFTNRGLPFQSAALSCTYLENAEIPLLQNREAGDPHPAVQTPPSPLPPQLTTPPPLSPQPSRELPLQPPPPMESSSISDTLYRNAVRRHSQLGQALRSFENIVRVIRVRHERHNPMDVEGKGSPWYSYSRLYAIEKIVQRIADLKDCVENLESELFKYRDSFETREKRADDNACVFF